MKKINAAAAVSAINTAPVSLYASTAELVALVNELGPIQAKEVRRNTTEFLARMLRKVQAGEVSMSDLTHLRDANERGFNAHAAAPVVHTSTLIEYALCYAGIEELIELRNAQAEVERRAAIVQQRIINKLTVEAESIDLRNYAPTEDDIEAAELSTSIPEELHGALAHFYRFWNVTRNFRDMNEAHAAEIDQALQEYGNAELIKAWKH